MRRAASLVLLVATLTLHAPGARAQAVLPKLIGNVAPGSQLVGCDQADQRITVAVTTHLDPACVYTLGFEVTASNVVLDCRGAVVESPIADGRGIHIRAHEVLDTTFNGNRSNGLPVAVLAPGVQPPINPFLFAKSFWVE
jgi:hypothetical protein